jgi:prepilin-type N-terminal cleavage/methylation domain-containing protein
MVRRTRTVSRAGDQGFTLIEMMISLLVFAIFLSLLIGTIVGITRANTRVNVTAQTTSGILIVFQIFDRQIRYSDAINFPGAGTTSRYIEFRTPATSSSTGNTMCTQWRFDPVAKTLSSRQWTDGNAASATAFVMRLSNVADDGGATYPFQLTPASNAGSAMQQLVLSIDGGNAPVKGAAITTTFVARNSSIKSPSNTQAVTPGVSDTPVCTFSGYRP